MRRIQIIKAVIIVFLSVCIVGCNKGESSKQSTEDKQNIYQLNYDTTTDNYISLSDKGIDYIFPDFKENTGWSSWKTYEDECKESSNSIADSYAYIIRNADSSVNINAKDYASYLDKNMKRYVGDIDFDHGRITYSNDIGFYSISGKVKHDNENYYYSAVCFTSYEEIPSVSDKKIPTCFIVLYKDRSDKSSVSEMISTWEEWVLYDE